MGSIPVLAVEDGLPVRAERFDEDVLDRLGVFVASIQLAAALGLAQMDPVGGAVAGPGEAGCFAEGLQQHGSDAVALLPVLGQLAFEAGQQMGGQAGQADPGQDGHTIPTLGMRRSPSITGSIRWPMALTLANRNPRFSRRSPSH